MWYVRLVLCLVCSFLLVIDADFSTVCFYLCVSIYISLLKPYFSFIIGPVVYVLDLADRLISKACPFAAAGIMVGSIYWTAVTYGAVTVMQVLSSSLFCQLQSKSQFCLLFPCLGTCLAAFSVVTSEFKMVFHV